jgi:hypothetical protein
MESRERRREKRVQTGAEVRLNWDAGGEAKYAVTRTFDLSPSGIKVQLMEGIDRGTYVRVQADRLKLSGTAVVRNCTRKGGKFWMGLEFAGGTKIQLPPA